MCATFSFLSLHPRTGPCATLPPPAPPNCADAAALSRNQSCCAFCSVSQVPWQLIKQKFTWWRWCKQVTSVKCILSLPLSMKYLCEAGQLANPGSPRIIAYFSSSRWQIEIDSRKHQTFPTANDVSQCYLLRVLRTIKRQNRILELEM